ncbi:hypothetical protein E4U55_005471 [Claviceps digitariae]|nr:hypothetical protein E4U55_005471 [Claviceps digitariae]
MAHQHLNLRSVLTQAKPLFFRAWPEKISSNTTNQRWPKLHEIDPIAIWDEFNLTNLNESYGHVLDISIQDGLAPNAEQCLGNMTMAEARDINHLIMWNNAIIRATVPTAQWELGLHPNVVIRHECSTVERPKQVRLESNPALSIDHIISLDDFPESFLVVGLGRPSPKWSGRKLSQQLKPKADKLWPLRQLAGLCEVAKTRYGYIQTDEELVVCCFSVDDGFWRVKFMPVPWSRCGADALTTDLALWWLCMLAMSADVHRAIVEEEEMVRIDEWDYVFMDDDRGWVRRHRYSNFEQRTPPPPSYTSPSPGNTAVFGAQLLLDAANASDSASTQL